MVRMVGSGEWTNGRGSRIRSHGNCIDTRTNGNTRTEVKDSLINIMLRTSLYTPRLHTQYRLVRALSAQERVCAEAFPISSTLSNTSENLIRPRHKYGEHTRSHPRFINGPSATCAPLPLNSSPILRPRVLIKVRLKLQKRSDRRMTIGLISDSRSSCV